MSHLHAVKSSGKAATPRRRAPRNLVEAVNRDERDLLVALRRKIAREIDEGVPAHALAPLMRQMREIDHDIRALDAREREDSDGDGEQVEDGEFDPSSV